MKKIDFSEFLSDTANVGDCGPSHSCGGGR